MLLFSTSAGSDVIRFPDEELASEYVFPVFEDPKVVLNRNVTLSKRVEWYVSSGFRTDEPLYNLFSLFSSFTFYWNESHGMGVSGLYFFPGLSSRVGKPLRKEGVKIGKSKEVESYFDASLAPHPLYAVFLNYQFSPLYGKISITKAFALNFALYSFIAAGALGMQHGTNPIAMVPASHFGIGQRFYFNRYFGLGIGIDILLYYGPNPISRKLQWKPGENTPARPKYSEFNKELFFRFLPRVGIIVLL